MLSTFIKLPIVIKIFVLSIFEWLFYTGLTVLWLMVAARKNYLRFFNPYMPTVLFGGTLPNCAKPDQMPQNVMSDQILHCIITECTSNFFWMKL